MSRRKLGQHFLRDNRYLELIVRSIAAVPQGQVIEIGPGRGALTAHLLDAGYEVTALEIDATLIPALRKDFAGRPLTVIAGDAREFAFDTLGSELRVVGNLPYLSATVILQRLLEFAEGIEVMVLMFQKEVAERIAAGPGSRAYGSLSVFTAFHCRTEYLTDVPPGAFSPPPEVTSGLVRLRPHRPQPDLPADERRAFLDLVRKAFSHRRKTILNALIGAGFGREQKDLLRGALAAAGIAESERPERVDLDRYRVLAAALGATHGSEPS